MGNHSISGQRMLEVLNIDFDTKWFSEEQMRELKFNFPNDLKDLKEEK